MSLSQEDICPTSMRDDLQVGIRALMTTFASLASVSFRQVATPVIQRYDQRRRHVTDSASRHRQCVMSQTVHHVTDSASRHTSHASIPAGLCQQSPNLVANLSDKFDVEVSQCPLLRVSTYPAPFVIREWCVDYFLDLPL